jgi:hypothetical protein
VDVAWLFWFAVQLKSETGAFRPPILRILCLDTSSVFVCFSRVSFRQSPGRDSHPPRRYSQREGTFGSNPPQNMVSSLVAQHSTTSPLLQKPTRAPLSGLGTYCSRDIRCIWRRHPNVDRAVPLCPPRVAVLRAHPTLCGMRTSQRLSATSLDS